MLNRFLHTVNLWNWDLSRHETLLAVSGGADSVVLAHLFKANNFPFAMAHVNYGLRGDDSKADELFVRNLAAELGVEVFVFEADMGIENRGKSSLQMYARKLRYEFFNEVRNRFPNRFHKIAVAHHATDNLEHFFLYLLRNNREVAWRGILHENGPIIRPLLGYSKSEIYAMAVENKWLWREDKSNAKIDYKRNKIRNWILPLIDLHSELDFYQISFKKQRIWLKNHENGAENWENNTKVTPNGVFIPSYYLTNLSETTYVKNKLLSWGFSKEVANKLIQNAVKVGANFESKVFSKFRKTIPEEFLIDAEAIEDTQEQGSIAGNHQVVLSVGRNGVFAHLKNRDLSCKSFVVTGMEHWKNSSKVDLGTCDLYLLKDDSREEMDAVYAIKSALFPMEIRSWKEGDKIQIAPKQFQKISDLFTNAKVEQFDKKGYPILLDASGKVLAVMGLRKAWEPANDADDAMNLYLGIRWK